MEAVPTTRNPTQSHLWKADAARERAAEHEAAAAELERFENDACRSVSPEARASCPLLGPFVSAELISGGVRLRLEPGADAAPIVAAMRCHQAFARSRGHAGADGCALYVEGADVAATSDGSAVDITAEDADAVEAIRRRFSGASTPPGTNAHTLLHICR